MIGQQISHYLIDSQIGRGGMGVVYKARDMQLSRWVAIKAIHQELLHSFPNVVRRLREEASVTASLDHPYICKVFEVLGHGEETLIVMEWVQGKTLKELMADGLPRAKVLRYFTELAEALDSAHRQQLVHRDIKPSNVIVTQHDHVKLMDFGLVKVLGEDNDHSWKDATDLTAPQTRLGTVRYMSPEQACGDPLDQRSDLFSLGVVMFEALTGKLPFRGATQFDYLQDVLHHQPRQIAGPEGSTSQLEKIVMRCLAKDPDQRFSDAGNLAQALKKIKIQDSEARPSTPWIETVYRGRLVFMLIPFAVILALLINVFWLKVDPAPRALPLLESSLVTGSGDQFGSRISPNGEWISFVTQSKGRTELKLTRVGRGQPQSLVSDQSISSHVWSPDGTLIAYLSEEGGMVRLRLIEAPIYSGTSRRDEVLTGPLGASLIRWIGNHLYLSGYQSVWRFDLESAELTLVAEKPPTLEFWRHFDVSPDEQQLVFSAVRQQQEDLFISSLDGDDLVQLTHDEATQEIPRWVGSEAQHVVFSSDRGGQMDLWEVDVNSQETRQLTSSRSAEYVDDTSADGLMISFQEIQQESDIWAHVPGRGPRQVTVNARLDLWPSSAGKNLAFQRSRPTSLQSGTHFFDGEILLSREEDAEFQQLESQGFGFAPRLSSDGRWLFFFRLGNQGPYRTELWQRDLESGREQSIESSFQLSGFLEFPTELLANTLAWTQQNRDLFYVALSEQNSPQILKYHPETGDRLVQVSNFKAGEEIRDLFLSPSESKLSYLHWVREGDQKQRFTLFVLDLESGRLEPWGSWTEDPHSRVLVRGWSTDDSLVMLRSRFAEGSSESAEVRQISALETSAPIARISDVVAVSFRLSRDRQRLFFTAIENGIHNVFELALKEGTHRRITANLDEGVSFSSFETTRSGQLFYARQQRKQNIGLLRNSP